MTAIDWDIAQHTDVVCPPDPHAACRHCGDELRDHSSSDPDKTPTPGDAACTADAGAAFWARRAPQQFELADGERLDCPDVMACPVCDSEICSEHSNEFTTCAGSSSTLHHGDCRHACPDCQDAAADDARGRS